MQTLASSTDATAPTRRAASTAPDHVLIDPAILYFGTPVALISTTDCDGRANLAPMSSVFFLGKTAILGLGARSQTALNLIETEECVINLPSADQVTNVDRLALTTGRDPVPHRKHQAGYRHVADKFARAGLTAVVDDPDRAPRVAECPVNLRGRVRDRYELEKHEPARAGSLVSFEVDITQVYVHEAIRVPGSASRVDPDRWRPLIMSFQRFYGLGPELHPSRLSTIDEEWYR